MRSGIRTDATDAAVIERSAQRPEAFALLFDRHASTIHRYLARRVGGETADDLVGEVFLIAFAKREGYDASRTGALPWLYGIATNLLGQHRREEVKRYRLRARAEMTSARDPDDLADRLVGDVTARSVRAELADALSAVPAGDRDVLVLVACEDLSYEEAAVALGIPVGTVRSRLHRVRTYLRRALSRTESAATYEEILSNE